ncbi:hypothetical protein V9T40_013698 [Parthenolecanium corni]|uniref:Fatty acyl-CoA reductase n=1 Tax=Parthenolecanium corni TaxID=536013 RepID=A0AAN9TBP1_9HEMI
MVDSIAGYFVGRSIFVTGGTGFMGKVLIEKLLRSCPGIEKIYVLIRPSKKGSPEERLANMISVPLFDRLKSERPGSLESKLQAISGDVTELELGMSASDRKLLTDNVSIVFHTAASVRFDDPLHEAIKINVRGTREVVNLTKEMKNIAVFLHVSTTYCNCYRKIIEEVVYPAPYSWRNAIYIAENADVETLSILSQKFLGPFPNTYVFTKNLSEQLIKEECENIPSVIFRPSIVISTAHEPVPGWIDTFLGPVGLITGIAKGVIRCAISRDDTRPDYMPVDIAIKGIIGATWKAGNAKDDESNLTVYNCSSGYKSITSKELMQIGMEFAYKLPFPESIWIPSIMYTTNKTCFYVNTVLKQVLPAVAINTLMKMKGRKFIDLVRLQRKIYLAALALSYFTSKSWMFINDNFLGLLTIIPENEKDAFDVTYENIDPREFMETSILGGHKYLLKTDFSQIPIGARKLKR